MGEFAWHQMPSSVTSWAAWDQHSLWAARPWPPRRWVSVPRPVPKWVGVPTRSPVSLLCLGYIHRALGLEPRSHLPGTLQSPGTRRAGWFEAGSRASELHPQQRGGAESLMELPSLFPVSALGACCRGCGDRLAGAERSAGSGHHPSSGSDGQARLQDTARCGGCPLVCKAGVEVWEDVLRDSWV